MKNISFSKLIRFVHWRDPWARNACRVITRCLKGFTISMNSIQKALITFHWDLIIQIVSDKILGDSLQPGGDIYIHGKCVTTGCIPIMDNQIEELIHIWLPMQKRRARILSRFIFSRSISKMFGALAI